jgi:phage terminase small subunit
MKLQHQLFVKHYVATGNATAAACAAGYSPKTAHVQGCRLLKNAKIRKGLEKVAEKAKLDAQWCLERSREIVERSMQAEPVLDREGNPTGEYTFNASGANTAIRNIAQIIGAMTEARHNPENRPEDMTKDELDARILEALARAEDAGAGEGEEIPGPTGTDSVH